eukprot:2690033-Rhodomonas_salina.1
MTGQRHAHRERAGEAQAGRQKPASCLCVFIIVYCHSEAQCRCVFAACFARGEALSVGSEVGARVWARGMAADMKAHFRVQQNPGGKSSFWIQWDKKRRTSFETSSRVSDPFSL